MATRPKTPAPSPAPRLGDAPSVNPLAEVALAAILGFGFWLIQREFGKRDKRKAILPRVRHDLAELEKHLSIVRDFPGMQFAPTQTLVARLRKSFLEENDIGLILSHKKHAVIATALEISEEVATYLAEQDAASTTLHKQEIVAAARRALMAIYAARAALDDSIPVKWPADPHHRNLWELGAEIPRNDYSQGSKDETE